MGFFSRLFGIETAQDKGTYEERLARMTSEADTPKQVPLDAEPPVTAPEQIEGAAAPDMYHDGDGDKVIPEVACWQVEPHLSGDRSQMDLWATLYNKSPFEIQITEVELLRERNRPGVFIKPGQKYEFRLYQGDTPKDDAYDDVIFRYKIVDNGDYFETRNFIEYDFEDGYYVPKAIKPDRAPRDI